MPFSVRRRVDSSDEIPLRVTPLTTAVGQSLVLVLGELDASTCRLLNDVVDEELAGSARRLVIDVRGVRFCDAAGLGALLSAARQAYERRCELVIDGASPALRRLIEAADLEYELPLTTPVPPPRPTTGGDEREEGELGTSSGSGLIA